MQEVFDENELMDRVDGDLEFLRETVEMLDEDSPSRLEEIRSAVEAADADALARSAHALKGVLSNFCAPAAESAALELERMGREQKMDAAATALERVHLETQRVRDALHDFLRTKTA